MKISIFGGGIFGITIFLVLRKAGYDCYLYEKEKKLLSGASTKNLNRVHLGYHYPRDQETVTQSKAGFVSFKKFYSKVITKNFENYYAIAKKSKVNSQKYEKFLNDARLNYKKINLTKFKFKTNRIESIYKVKEPIYSWSFLATHLNNLIKKDRKRIYLKNFVSNLIFKNNKFYFNSNKKKEVSDVVVNASYEGVNTIAKSISSFKNFEYQLTNIMEINSKKFRAIGFALMDGPFFSFLPKGFNNNRQVLYHVKYSVLKKRKNKEFNIKWFKEKNKLNKIIKTSNRKTLNDLKKYLPEMDIKKIYKNYISSRVLLPKTQKTAKRISYITEKKKKYFEVFSGKVDHSVDIAYKILNKISKIKNENL